MEGLKYPLEQLMKIKLKRFEKAQTVLEEKRRLLNKEEEILKKKEEEKNEVLLHKQKKLDQLHQTLNEGTTSNKLLQMENYLDTVEEKLDEKIKKVKNQEKKVESARLEVEKAKKDLFQKKKDVEKLEIHKKEWKEEVDKWIKKQEQLVQNELGSIGHYRRKKEKG